MKKKLIELKEKLNRAWTEYKEYRNTLDEDPAKWTDEHRERIDKMNADMDSTEELITRTEKDIEREERFSATDGNQYRPNVDGNNRNLPVSDEEHRAAFNDFLRSGLNGISAENRSLLERRSVVAGDDVAGGFLTAPQQFVSELLQSARDSTVVRANARTFAMPKAESLGVVKKDTGLADWDWTPEVATVSEDSALAFGKRSMTPHQLTKLVLISRPVIRKSVISPEEIVRDEMSYKLGGTMESAYMTGSGSQQPLGLFTASDDGIPTSQDVSTSNTTTSVTFDNLVNVQGTLKSAYNGKWLFHRNAITKLRLIKDGDGNYIWQPGGANGTPHTILGAPYLLSEWCPNTWTTGLYVGLYGDLRYYWILDSLTMQMQVLNELYALTNKIGYLGRYEGDGQPVMSEAFVRVKLA